jgi:hypothetical protein
VPLAGDEDRIGFLVRTLRLPRSSVELLMRVKQKLE